MQGTIRISYCRACHAQIEWTYSRQGRLIARDFLGLGRVGPLHAETCPCPEKLKKKKRKTKVEKVRDVLRSRLLEDAWWKK